MGGHSNFTVVRATDSRSGVALVHPGNDLEDTSTRTLVWEKPPFSRTIVLVESFRFVEISLRPDVDKSSDGVLKFPSS